MSAEHTQGKIRYERDLPFDGSLIAADGHSVCDFETDPRPADARRLVACWNALVGIPTDKIEQVVNEEIVEPTWKDLKDQNAELLKALKCVLVWMEDQSDAQSKGGHQTFDLMMLRYELEMVRAAIAKAEGGEA